MLLPQQQRPGATDTAHEANICLRQHPTSLLVHGLQAVHPKTRGLHTWVARYLGLANGKSLPPNWKASTCPANPRLCLILHQAGLVLHHNGILFRCALRSLEALKEAGNHFSKQAGVLVFLFGFDACSKHL